MRLETLGWLLVLGGLAACGRSASTAEGEESAGVAGQSSSSVGAASGGGAGASATTAGSPGLSGSSGRAGDGGRAGAGELGGTAGSGEGGNGQGGEAGSGERCEPPEPDDQCIQDRQLKLGPFVVVDQDGDGRVEAGEKVVLHGQLSNPGPESHYDYPGVVFKVSEPSVEPAMGDWHDLFGLLAGDSQSFQLSFEMPDIAPAGTNISVEVWPSGINAQPSCCGQHARTVELVIEESM